MTYHSISDAKKNAAVLGEFGECQFILEAEGGFELAYAVGVVDVPRRLDGKRVVAYRTFRATDYANDQQGAWIDVGEGAQP